MNVKNLSELNELMNSEMLAYKKCCNYVASTTDSQLKEKLGTFANRHKLRFETLLDYLNSHG